MNTPPSRIGASDEALKIAREVVEMHDRNDDRLAGTTQERWLEIVSRQLLKHEEACRQWFDQANADADTHALSESTRMLTEKEFLAALRKVGEEMAADGKPVIKHLLTKADEGLGGCMFENWQPHLQREAYAKVGVLEPVLMYPLLDERAERPGST